MENFNENFKNIPEDGQSYRDMIDCTRFSGLQSKVREVIQKKREQSMLSYGRPDPFYVWVDNNTPNKLYLLYDHSDFQFVLEHNIPFWVIIMKFESEDEAKVFIDGKQLDLPNLTVFQRVIIALRFKDTHMRMGRINMSFGGKGVDISNKTNTLQALAEIADCSTGTVNKVEYIIPRLKDEESFRLLESGEKSIDSVYKKLIEGTKSKDEPETNLNCAALEQTPQFSIEVPLQSLNELDNNSPFNINEKDRYTVAFINTPFDSQKFSRASDLFIEDLKQMNVPEFMYNEFGTLIIKTPANFLIETLDIIRVWGFTYADTMVIQNDHSKDKSKYSEQYQDLLLICERNYNGVPPIKINIRTEKTPIHHTAVMDAIDSLFDNTLKKVGIFTESRKGWDTYNFDQETKQMVKSTNKKAA